MCAYTICLLQLYDLTSLSVDSTAPVSQVKYYARLALILTIKFSYLIPFQPSVCTLYPPHYDAVTSFGLYKDLLFSSCGVTIKQWDIKERCLKHVNYFIQRQTTLVVCIMPEILVVIDFGGSVLNRHCKTISGF